ncbi:aKG-HExxH-type peptide beta-hydroxylase [Nocardia bovistercoris]|uniref:HEXXH motif domain-containing protein n=1 Tax=Nocardia bovistercoris TaxID=2785916 RepID=A0A931IGR1_9NOCA|nr:HEXXH motif-containing putative peptide modification protein [Nocardia bovistercoris]MBH0781437.1 hypothetical protein [Nocardia bovistercoris]
MTETVYRFGAPGAANTRRGRVLEVSDAELDAVAALADPATLLPLLRRTRLSRNLAFLAAVLRGSDASARADDECRVVRRSFELLSAVQRRAPARAREVLLHPRFGAWAAVCAVDADIGRQAPTAHLASFAAAAAARAGMEFDLELPSVGGAVVLPGMGAWTGPATDTARIRGTAGGVLAPHGYRWTPIRRLRAPLARGVLDIEFDDLPATPAAWSDAVADTETADTASAETDSMDAVTSGAAMLGTVTSDAGMSGAGMPDAVMPGAVMPGTVTSDAVMPGTVTSDAAMRGGVTPGAVMSGAVMPDAVTSGTVTPGAAMRGAVTSGTTTRDTKTSGTESADAGVAWTPWPDTEFELWRGAFAEAIPLLAAAVPELATPLIRGIRAILPRRAKTYPFTSATLVDMFGAAAMIQPDDAVGMATGLLHEFQHSKLSALMEIRPLIAVERPADLPSPWRADPRPASAVLHGVYAHLAVSRFLRRAADHAGSAPVPAAEPVRGQTLLGCETLLDSDRLTPAGRRFVTVMRHTAATDIGDRTTVRWQ